MSNSLASIIVTVYNKEKYILQTLQSALTQTYSDIEVIVVNDGSTDGSPKVIKQIAATDPRVLVITQTNAGAAAARNRGIDTAQGEFVNLFDGDDLLYPHFVEETVGFLQRNLDVDVVHTSWDRIDDQGRKIGTAVAPDSDDYLRDLLLGNMFAPSAMMFRKNLLDRIGPVRDWATDDWEYFIRCAKGGAKFERIPEVLAAYRDVPNSHRKQKERQENRFFPVIEYVFDGTMTPEHQRLKDLSIIRHRFFLMVDYLNWGLPHDAKDQFEIGLAHLREKRIADPGDISRLMDFVSYLTLIQTVRFSKALADIGGSRQAAKVWVRRLSNDRLGSVVISIVSRLIRKAYIRARRNVARIDVRLGRIRRASGYEDYALQTPTTLDDIRRLSLDYLSSMRLTRGGQFIGYRHSASTTKPVLYATLASLLLKHLYGVEDEQVAEELEFVLRFQSDDGVFRDPVIACPEAETQEWWGWRHLTLHALMTLALYDVPARKEFHSILGISDKDRFREYLRTRDWGERVAWTSNELQNVGVMLQYARDYQNSASAGALMEILFEELEIRQDARTGLYGNRFDTPMQLSQGVQAGYHFWLLYFSDHRPINHVERIIDSLLHTQNALGGYGVKWNSNACEDIDSIDPLVRLSRQTDYRREDIQESLRKALPALLHTLNGDGGWVFRRHEPLTLVHPQMFSATNESNVFYTWFRVLGLAYCLCGLRQVPAELTYSWNFASAPGHQFLDM